MTRHGREPGPARGRRRAQRGASDSGPVPAGPEDRPADTRNARSPLRQRGRRRTTANSRRRHLPQSGKVTVGTARHEEARHAVRVPTGTGSRRPTPPSAHRGSSDPSSAAAAGTARGQGAASATVGAAGCCIPSLVRAAELRTPRSNPRRQRLVTTGTPDSSSACEAARPGPGSHHRSRAGARVSGPPRRIPQRHPRVTGTASGCDGSAHQPGRVAPAAPRSARADQLGPWSRFRHRSPQNSLSRSRPTPPSSDAAAGDRHNE